MRVCVCGGGGVHGRSQDWPKGCAHLEYEHFTRTTVRPNWKYLKSEHLTGGGGGGGTAFRGK